MTDTYFLKVLFAFLLLPPPVFTTACLLYHTLKQLNTVHIFTPSSQSPVLKLYLLEKIKNKYQYLHTNKNKRKTGDWKLIYSIQHLETLRNQLAMYGEWYKLWLTERIKDVTILYLLTWLKMWYQFLLE